MSNEAHSELVLPPGLPNHEKGCYLHATIHALASCGSLTAQVQQLSIQHSDIFRLSVLNVIFQYLNPTEKRDSNVSTELTECYLHSINWTAEGQQDSFHILSYIVNETFKELKPDSQPSLQLYMRYLIRCPCGKITSGPRQSDLALHVPYPDLDNENFGREGDLQTQSYPMEDLIEIFFSETEAELVCDADGCSEVLCLRQVQLVRPLPRTLCLHMNKTRFNGDVMQRIDSRAALSERLNIYSWFLGPTLESQGKVDGARDRAVVAVYRLMAVIVHMGTATGGHYRCYRRVRDSLWVLTDDSHVEVVDLHTTVLASDPYIVLYELE